MPPSSPIDRDYWCFLSYRHADNKEAGRRWASWLHRELETYAVPADLVGTTNSRGDVIPSRIYPVFRDEEELPADAELAGPIEEALRQSRTLIVICSPRSAASRFVADEVRVFKAQGKANRVLAAIIAGEPNVLDDPSKRDAGWKPEDECFCEPLRRHVAKDGTVTEKKAEPIAADFRIGGRDEGWTSREAYGRALPANLSRAKRAEILREYGDQLQLMKLKLIAGVLGIPVGVLTERDKAYQLQQAQRRARRFAWLTAAFALLGLAAAAAGWVAWKKSEETLRTLAQTRHQQAVERVRGGRAFDAMSYTAAALELMPEDPASAALAFSLLSHDFPQIPARPPVKLNGEVISFELSPDGTQLLIAGLGVPVQVWDLKDGSLAAEVPANSGEMLSAGFTADGRGTYVFSDRTLEFRLWEGIPSGEPAGVVACQINLGQLLISSPANGVMATTIAGRTQDIYEVISGASYESYPVAYGSFDDWLQPGIPGVFMGDDHTALVTHFRMSRDGTRIGTGDEEGVFKLWDAVGKRQIASHAAEEEITSVSFDPEGRLVLVASEDGSLKAYETEGGTQVFTWSFGDDPCLAAGFSADGSRFVASSGTDNRWIQVWDAESRKRLGYVRPGSTAQDIFLASGGDTIVSHNAEDGLSLWDVPGRRLISAPNVLDRFETDRFIWSEPLGMACLVDDSHALRLYPSDSDRLSCIRLPHAEGLDQAVFSPDGTVVLTVSNDSGTTRLWDVRTALPLSAAVANPGAIKLAGISADGARAVLAETSGRLHQYPIAESTQEADEWLPGILNGAGLTAFSPNSRWVAQSRLNFAGYIEKLTNSTDSLDLMGARDAIGVELVALDTNTGKVAWRRGIDGQYFLIACSNDGETVLALGSREVGDPITVVGFQESGETGQVEIPEGLGGMIFEISRDNAHAVVANGQAGGLLLRVSPLRRIAQLSHLRELNAAAFSPDGSLVATASDDGTARLWYTADGSPASPPLEHEDLVLCLDFSDDGRWLLTGSLEGTATVWETATGRQASIALDCGDSVRDVDFSPDGRWILTASDDGYARLWEWLPPGSGAPPEWIADATTLVSEIRLARSGYAESADGLTAKDLRSRASTLPESPWRSVVENLLRPPAERRVTPSSLLTLAEDRLRLARCALIDGDHSAAVDYTRLALKLDPELSIPNEMTNVARLVRGEPLESAGIQFAPGTKREGAGVKAGDLLDGPAGLKLRWCPPGKLMMGAPPRSPGRWGNETYREVFLTHGYWIAETETTQGQWEAVTGQTLLDLARSILEDTAEYAFDGPSQPAVTLRVRNKFSENLVEKDIVAIQDAAYPVYYVSQGQAAEFCERLNALSREEQMLPEGWEFRLPTEAEWEYACRAGRTGTLYEGEIAADHLQEVSPEVDHLAWYSGNSLHGYPADRPGWPVSAEGKPYPGRKAGPREVAKKRANAWGLFDMLGNVHEWTGSRDSESLIYQRVNPQVTAGDYAVYRGGGWNTYAVGCRCSSRSTASYQDRKNFIGFRVVLAPAPAD